MYQVIFGELSSEAMATASDIAQKIEAIDGASIALQNERTEVIAAFDEKERALQAEKSNLRNALRALRPVSLSPVK